MRREFVGGQRRRVDALVEGAGSGSRCGTSLVGILQVGPKIALPVGGPVECRQRNVAFVGDDIAAPLPVLVQSEDTENVAEVHSLRPSVRCALDTGEQGGSVPEAPGHSADGVECSGRSAENAGDVPGAVQHRGARREVAFLAGHLAEHPGPAAEGRGVPCPVGCGDGDGGHRLQPGGGPVRRRDRLWHRSHPGLLCRDRADVAGARAESADAAVGGG
mmetsp:Transcript_11923/g.31930  ORF Transcript_11923/g.31930 Transcript_11923/m.31930 type:complete len:218 (-) Transcript_11923:1174-1827(-)